MSDLIKAIVAATILHHGVGVIILGYYESKSKVYIDACGCYLNPIWLHKNYKVNYFGCLILTILFNIACPLLSIIYWLCKFIKWIMTVGRK